MQVEAERVEQVVQPEVAGTEMPMVHPDEGLVRQLPLTQVKVEQREREHSKLSPCRQAACRVTVSARRRTNSFIIN